jgi:hypothetical protein
MVTEVDLEELKKMIRHLHHDVETIKRNQTIIQTRLINIANLIQIGTEDAISNVELDKAINLDPDEYSSADELYSAIDDVDKIAWEQYVRAKKEREEESKRLDWST